jgi:Lambda phage tail tube protein, TTP
MPNIEATTFTLVGGQFQIGNGASPEIFTTLTQVTDVDFGSMKWDTPEVTSADNNDGVKRFTRTLKDPGDCTVTFLFNPQDPTHQQAKALVQAGATLTPTNFKFLRPGTFGTVSFAGCAVSCEEGKIGLDKPVVATLKIKVSGELVYSILA